MNLPLVSVITTSYNTRRFIKASLESINQQSYQNIEHIILDDGSTDKTSLIIKEFHSKKITLHRILYADNAGLCKRQKHAIDISLGKYIAIQDSDDISLPDRILEEIQYLESHPDIFCVGSDAIVIDESGRNIDNYDYPPENNSEIVNMFIKGINPIINPSCMFRKETFYKLGGFEMDPSFEVISDFALWMRAAANGEKFHNIKKSLVMYRKHAGSMSNRFRNKVSESHKKIHSLYKDEITKRNGENNG